MCKVWERWLRKYGQYRVILAKLGMGSYDSMTGMKRYLQSVCGGGGGGGGGSWLCKVGLGGIGVQSGRWTVKISLHTTRTFFTVGDGCLRWGLGWSQGMGSMERYFQSGGWVQVKNHLWTLTLHRLLLLVLALGAP